MTTVSATEFYEWPMNNDTADCEDCGKEMKVPPVDDIDRDMKEPFWWKEDVETYIGGNYDKFHALCDSCYGERMSELMNEGGSQDER